MLKQLNVLSGKTRLQAWCGCIRDWHACTRGAVSIELGFVAIILATLAVGAFDFGRFGVMKTRVTSAARAGAQYGVQDLSAANDSAGMIGAALTDMNAVSADLSVQTARTYCECTTGGEVACDTTCSDGGFAPQYVEVQIGQDIELLFGYPGVPENITVESTSSMRVR